MQSAEKAGTVRWVFGYGSLMWRPEFDHVERQAATLHGRHRAFCIYSVHHRGTPERKGLVLGLAPGGTVRGAAYRVADADWERVYAYLREREQPTETYVEARAAVRLADGRRVEAMVFLSDKDHPQWAGRLDLEAQARLIAGARGLSGPNVAYLRDLVEHLRQEGARDSGMERLLARVEALEGTRQPSSDGKA
ncbi:MAG TPA: gamma-glutamylcyclotransferase [Caulobacteraceae bacterium]|jgi:cation transport protein ChaC|nr:gamma-glutamylcyclotransferase [Caulobacteraceae bacterium]